VTKDSSFVCVGKTAEERCHGKGAILLIRRRCSRRFSDWIGERFWKVGRGRKKERIKDKHKAQGRKTADKPAATMKILKLEFYEAEPDGVGDYGGRS